MGSCLTFISWGTGYESVYLTIRHAEFWVMSTNMAAGHESSCVDLDENEIYGAKLTKDVDFLSKAEAIRWLKCRGSRNLSDLTLKESKAK